MAAKRNQEQVNLGRKDSGGGDQAEEQRIKVPKMEEHVWDWDDDRVGCIDLDKASGKSGLSYKFRKKADYKPTHDEIEKAEFLYVPTRRLHLYKSFKEGLTKLQALIQNLQNSKNSSPKPILLLHGIPAMGKSCLAMGLAYCLAMYDGNAAYIKMQHYNNTTAENATDSLSRYFMNAAVNRWTILDQCDVNCLDLDLLLNMIDFPGVNGDESQRIRWPLIMFTSGHYVPSISKWCDSRFVEFRVINLEVDKDVITNLKDRYQISDEVLDPNDLLAITNVYGRVQRFLTSDCLRNHETKMTMMDDMFKSVYDVNQLNVKCHNLEVFWLLLPRLVQAKQADLEEGENSPQIWSIKPEVVYCLGRLLNEFGDPKDDGRNLIMDLLCVATGNNTNMNLENISVKTSGFFMYKYNEYFYHFPHVKKLHEVLTEWYSDTDPHKKYQTLYKTYLVVTEEAKYIPQSCRGEVFEMLISLGCEIGKVCLQVSCNSHATPREANIVEQTRKVLAKDVDELCKQVEDIRRRGNTEVIWCELNVPGKRPFKGYDFAYVEVRDSKIIRFDLLQVSVNAGEHPKAHMLTVLQEVENILGIKPQPYFIVPKRSTNEDHVQIAEDLQVQVARFDVDPSVFLCRA